MNEGWHGQVLLPVSRINETRVSEYAYPCTHRKGIEGFCKVFAWRRFGGGRLHVLL